ncbi:MAG: P-type conjugative transfer protein VirB9 [Proteobacteria bacterium]|nr:P-type conjugative transfer protein VirB9 [Pseudomonadota bacterium]
MLICSALVGQICASEALAGSSPRPLGGEQRIKVINYMPNTVFKFVGHYTYQSIIEFGIDEVIQTISMGTPTPWQLVPAGNRIFLKPVESDATTNMTVITNKRMYFFEMHAEEAKGVKDTDLSFIVKFVYPEDQTFNSIRQMSVDAAPDLTHPERYNFQYTISGEAKYMEPLQVFDDGEFTFFKFRDINAELPAVFLVNSGQRESLVNFRIQGGYMVVERVAEKFTFRHGPDVLCIFNEAYGKKIPGSKQ